MRRSVRIPLPADLIAKIDAVRGRRTRAAEIARRLEESLRPTAADHLRAALAYPEAYEPPTFVRTDGTWTVGPGTWSTQPDGLTWTAAAMGVAVENANVHGDWRLAAGESFVSVADSPTPATDAP